MRRERILRAYDPAGFVSLPRTAATTAARREEEPGTGRVIQTAVILAAHAAAFAAIQNTEGIGMLIEVAIVAGCGVAGWAWLKICQQATARERGKGSK